MEKRSADEAWSALKKPRSSQNLVQRGSSSAGSGRASPLGMSGDLAAWGCACQHPARWETVSLGDLGFDLLDLFLDQSFR